MLLLLLLLNGSESGAPLHMDDDQPVSEVAAAAAAAAATPGALAHQMPGQLEPAYAQFRDQTRFWIQRVAVPMIMVVGLFGNLITVIIMTRRRMRSTTNMYLAALAFVDMLYLVLTFLLGLSHYPNVARRRYYLYWRLKPFLMMLTDSCSNTSVWLTVTFTIERFIAVRYPIKGKLWCTEARAKRLIVCVFLFAILFTLPTPFEWKVVERRVTANAGATPPTQLKTLDANNANVSDMMNGDNATELASNASAAAAVDAVLSPSMPSLNESPITQRANMQEPTSTSAAAAETEIDSDSNDDQVIVALEYSDFGSNDTYKTIYYWSTAAIFYFIPLLSLTFFNGFLIHSVHQSRRERTKMTNQRCATSSGQVPVFDRGRPSAAVSGGAGVGAGAGSSAKLHAANKNYNHLERAQRGLIVEHLVSKLPSGKFPEVKSKVIGAPANQDNDVPEDENSTEASPRAPTFDRDHQQNDCDKRDCNLLSGAFVPPAHEPVTSLAKSNCQQQQQRQQTGNVLATRSAPPTERARDPNRTADDAITRLYLAASDNTAVLRGGSLEVSGAVERGTRGAGCNEALPSATLDVTPRSHLVSLDSSITNNRSSCSSYNESSATPAHQQASTMAPASSQERRITIMLISVVILFLVCQIPTAAMLLYTSVHETLPNTNEQALQLALGNIFNFLMAVNAAGNFILYSFLSKKYRRTFVILFCGCLRRAAKRRHAENNSTQTKLSSCPSNAQQQAAKSTNTTNTSGLIATHGATTRRWASVRFSKVSKSPNSVDTRRILIQEKDDTSKSHLIKAVTRKRRDTLV